MDQGENMNWRDDPALYSCSRTNRGNFATKDIDYSLFVNEFIDKFPLREFKIDIPKHLFYSAVTFVDITKCESLLDCGCASGEFIDFANSFFKQTTGLELHPAYAKNGQSFGRDVRHADICTADLPEYDMVFSCHVLGMTRDMWLALKQMWKWTRYYLVIKLGVPGSEKKHYSLIHDTKIFDCFIEKFKPNVLANGPCGKRPDKDWIFIAEKI
jgi:SAM-dependent methyltransferase